MVKHPKFKENLNRELVDSILEGINSKAITRTRVAAELEGGHFILLYRSGTEEERRLIDTLFHMLTNRTFAQYLGDFNIDIPKNDPVISRQTLYLSDVSSYFDRHHIPTTEKNFEVFNEHVLRGFTDTLSGYFYDVLNECVTDPIYEGGYVYGPNSEYKLEKRYSSVEGEEGELVWKKELSLAEMRTTRYQVRYVIVNIHTGKYLKMNLYEEPEDAIKAINAATVTEQ